VVLIGAAGMCLPSHPFRNRATSSIVPSGHRGKELDEDPGGYLFPDEPTERGLEPPGVFPCVCQPHNGRTHEDARSSRGP
jgi:hypothetical protein